MLIEILPSLPGKIIIDDKAPQLLPMLQIKQNTAALSSSASAPQQSAQTAQAMRAAAAAANSGYYKSQPQQNRNAR